ncbi:hypothetical protein DEI97_014505 [Curtobacterium sp. MCLR17_032]|uniref:hypothetical protein n=1 Tax=Curtobacterium sp. MCLR17_032 TaxID=2175650 RepID=UPI000DA731EE|nr:hypothetical protein [Curtobacterium sp. MCLR17_032]WIE60949.1 hypothetical protein DEI97_014505 [Curtobacterium sp. MCLR17_032]
MGLPIPPLLDSQKPEENLPQLTETATETKQKRSSELYIGPRITEGNAQRLHFIGKFPGADVEACSIIRDRQDAPGTLPTIKGTDKLLTKLRSLGVIGRATNPDTKRSVYSLTKSGKISAESFGHTVSGSATLNGTSQRRASHYQLIAHVAAQFASPAGFFRDSLGIEPVGIEGVISEHEMRIAYEKVAAKLKKRKERGESGDFGVWRAGAMAAAIEAVSKDRIEWPDITSALPALLTLGEKETPEMVTKAVHQPDLAVFLDGDRDSPTAKNLLVEVELNPKSWEAYEQILRTYRAELDRGFVYSRVVYFTIGNRVETILRKVDRKAKTGLFESGLLVVLPLTHRDNTPVRFEKRITIQEN